MSEVTREHLIKQYNLSRASFEHHLENDLCVRADITAPQYIDIRSNIIRRFKELQDIMNSIIELESNEVGFLPNRSQIEKLIKEDYKNTYGTNGDSTYLEERIIGAKLIIKSLID